MAERGIKEVKEAWENRLMAMPGVMGVAIGLSKDRKRPCIKVYLTRGHSAQASAIPSEIDGHPVEVEVRGIFRATKSQ